MVGETRGLAAVLANAASPPGLARIAIDALSQVVGGGVSVARDLTEAMAQESPETRFTLFCVSDSLASTRFPDNVDVAHRPELGSLLLRLRWEQFELPSLLAKDGYDALLGLGGYAIFRSPIPQVSVWQNSNVFTRVPVARTLVVDLYIRVQRIVQAWSMPRAEMNVFITRDSLEEAGTRWAMDRVAHTVIPHGLREPAAAASTTGASPAPDAPYVLTVGHLFFHKNFETLIEAAALYRQRFGEPPRILVAGGVVDQAYRDRLEDKIAAEGLEDVIRFLGAQRPEEVAALYGGARAYVTTSLLESFGFTPLEAMSHGVPVLAGRASCIPEVCGDAALFCDPRDPTDVAEQLHLLLEDEGLRSELVARGRARARDFSWSRSARAYLDTLEDSVRTSRRTDGSSRGGPQAR